MVATINRFRPRSALGDVAKAHGLEPTKVREMVNRLPYSFWARFEERDAEGKEVSPFADLRTAYPHGHPLISRSSRRGEAASRTLR